MRLVISLLAALTLVACSEPEVQTAEVIRPIAWTQVSATQLEQLRTLSGIVAPVEATRLSFEVTGKIQQVEVKLGDTVNKGDLLARLNPRTFDLSIQSSQAQLEQNLASLADAESEYRRYAKLVEQGLVAQSGYDRAKAAFEAQKSAVDVARAQLDIARKNRQDSSLRAPYDGIITKRHIEPSQQIAAGQAAFEIEGTHGLEVNVMVPETLIRQLTREMVLPVRFPVLPGVSHNGRITEIGTRAESANAFPITVFLTEQDPGLRAGMTAEVDFTFEGVGRTGHRGRSIRIPLTALQAGLNQTVHVFVYDQKAQVVRKRQVQTENIMNNEVFISEGLKEGEIIATAGVAFLRDGQQVTLLDKHTQRFN